MKVVNFEVLGTVEKPTLLGPRKLVNEQARVVLDSPVFGHIVETKGRRLLNRDTELYTQLDANLKRIGGHDIEVDSAKTSTEIVISYRVGYR